MANAPRLKTPPGACDCHMHIFDARFPLADKARRKERDAPVSEYRDLQRRLGLERVVVVQPTAYGKDNRCTLEAIAELGAGARGIAVVDNTVSDASNWPHPLSRGGPMPDDAVLLDWAPDGKTRNRILVENPAELYGFQ